LFAGAGAILDEEELNQAMFNKDWTGKRGAWLRQFCHTISVKHLAVFREVTVVCVLLYSILLATQKGKGEDCPPKYVPGTADLDGVDHEVGYPGDLNDDYDETCDYFKLWFITFPLSETLLRCKYTSNPQLLAMTRTFF